MVLHWVQDAQRTTPVETGYVPQPTVAQARGLACVSSCNSRGLGSVGTGALGGLSNPSTPLFSPSPLSGLQDLPLPFAITDPAPSQPHHLMTKPSVRVSAPSQDILAAEWRRCAVDELDDYAHGPTPDSAKLYQGIDLLHWWDVCDVNSTQTH